MGSNLYDPKYGPKTKDSKIEEFSQEHRDCIEDFFLTFVQARKNVKINVVAKM
jgi:hypothetical protein